MSPRARLKKLWEEICPDGVKENEPLKPYTSLRIGGQADWLVEPRNLSAVERLLEAAKREKVPCFILGQGSNLLVSDRGIRGLVIRLHSLKSPKVIQRLKGGQILLEVEAGFPLANLVRFGIRQGLQGLEFLAGIPGSTGGAWAMNAGSYGREMKDLTVYLNTVSEKGPFRRRGKKELDFGYRSLPLEPGELILSGGLKLKAGKGESIREETRRLWDKRRAIQPLNLPSCGSVFKNPGQDFAGRLIEQAGLKGRQKGGAQISERHANFIVNLGQAGSGDVLYLMNLIRDRIKGQFGVLLEPEVRLWGCTLKKIE
ncbi:MAG: UDP-N-acetylmuramate dehydrogenase [Thermodesulfobacteriota bacterium]